MHCLDLIMTALTANFVYPPGPVSAEAFGGLMDLSRVLLDSAQVVRLDSLIVRERGTIGGRRPPPPSSRRSSPVPDRWSPVATR